MASLGQTEFAAMLKVLYPDKEPENVATRKYPLLSMISKDDDFEGESLPVPVFYEFPNGRSATFLKAQTNAKASKSVKFSLKQKTDFGNLTIDALTIRASRSNRGAFVKARKAEVDMMLTNLGRSAAIALYGTGSGSIGKVKSISVKTITLVDAADVYNFGVGMLIVHSTADGGGAVKTLVLTVASRVPTAGTVTFTANADGGGGNDPAVSDFMFVEGDYDLKVVGLSGWVPLTSPSATLFFGVDRSVDPTRLGGQRLDASANPIEENILTVAEDVVMEGGMPRWAPLHAKKFAELTKGLGSKVEYQGAGGNVASGFRGVDVHCSGGVITVFSDPACKINRGWVLTPESLMLHHLDGFPHLDTIDGLEGLRNSGSDGIEVRARYWAELGCNAPGWNGTYSI
jgi:hypothetical protein